MVRIALPRNRTTPFHIDAEDKIRSVEQIKIDQVKGSDTDTVTDAQIRDTNSGLGGPICKT